MESGPGLNVLPPKIGGDVAGNLPRWQESLASAIRDPDELCDILGLPDSFREPARKASKSFPLIVPRSFVQRMEFGNPADPLLRQVLPLFEEDLVVGLPLDAVGDLHFQRTTGLLQKYHGRALFVLTGACAINCRFCFRRHYPYGDTPKGLEAWEPALQELAEDPTIEEVILSGGDPLAITDEWLERLSARFDAIGHLRRLRIHTRLPIVIPERVCDRLLAWLSASRLQPIVVLHTNHPREISSEVREAVLRLATCGILVLNQTVLLAGINDDADTLEELLKSLIAARVIPYYLHQLDRVQGVGHFEVALEKGKSIIAELRRRLPGYAIPRYVQEVQGEPHKTVLC